MYLDHFGLKEAPFRITPHTDFFFGGANRRATLEALLYSITHGEGIVKVTGEVGSGKTMLCRVLMDRLPPEVETVYLANPSLSSEEILHALADELRLTPSTARVSGLLREIQAHLVNRFACGKRVVVLIDEAHAMPKESLEEIRLFSNLESGRHKLLQIVLFGQPELDDVLAPAGMRQLKERITHSFRLEPLVREDIPSYIEFRMRAAGYKGPSVFTPGATRLIASASEGLTRRINILADKSLLSAFSRNSHQVTIKDARAAIRDSDFYRPQQNLSQIYTAGAALSGLLVGGAIGWGISSFVPIEIWPATVPEKPAAVGSKTAGHVPMETAHGPATASAPTHSPEPRQSLPRTERSRHNLDRPSPQEEPSAKGANTISPQQPINTRLLGALTRQRFEATQSWFMTAPGNLLAIQLLTFSIQETAELERFLDRVTRSLSDDSIWVYSVKIQEKQYLRVAYGAFPSIAAANAALGNIPEVIKARHPYLRTVARMKSQNAQ